MIRGLVVRTITYLKLNINCVRKKSLTEKAPQLIIEALLTFMYVKYYKTTN